MRMGINVVGRAMRGPARMADADAAGGRLLVQQFRQVADPTRFLAQVQPWTGQSDQSRRVISAVFQPPQAIHQNWLRLPATDVTDDPTHNRFLWLNA